MQRFNQQTGAVKIPYDTPEEYTSFANVLIEAESLLLDLQEYQVEALIEQEFLEEDDAFLEAEKEKAREEMGGGHSPPTGSEDSRVVTPSMHRCMWNDDRWRRRYWRDRSLV
jgi:hypothetical protein